MAAYKCLLLRVDLEVAKGRRTCRHDSKHRIESGRLSVVVREGQYRRAVYCAACGVAMMTRARLALEQLEGDLRSHQAFGEH